MQPASIEESHAALTGDGIHTSRGSGPMIADCQQGPFALALRSVAVETA